MSQPIPTANDTCAYQRCQCTIAGETVINRNGKTYCCEGCAAGDGCTHAVCNCVEKSE